MAKQQLNKDQSKGTAINQQSAGANSVVGVQFQGGWDYMTSVSGQTSMTKTITFPVPFTQILGIVCYPVGTAGTSITPTSIPQLNSLFSGGNLDTGASATLTGATFKIQLRSGAFGSTNEKWGFSWLAWGVM